MTASEKHSTSGPAKLVQELGLDFTSTLERVRKVATKTPLIKNLNLSRKYQCDVYLKREDLQVVRSYKLRGAYNMMSRLPEEQLAKEWYVPALATMHRDLPIAVANSMLKGVVFMPVITPKQKIDQTRMFGEGAVEIRLAGDNFDECADAAKKYTEAHSMTFIPPFDNERIIEGQSTVALEILQDLTQQIDFVFVPIGGGGLAAGVGLVFKTTSPQTKIIGLEPEGAPSMKEALKKGEPVMLSQIDRFVDGAAVKKVGDLTFKVCKEVLDDMEVVAEGKICSTILKLYNEDAIVVEPAGALSIASLDQYADQIKGKTVVCVVSGSNNDIDRMPEIKERSLQYEGLKHYFLIRFAQRPGALKEFVNDVLGPSDDITRFEYMQKTNKEIGPALVGIELQVPNDYHALVQKMKQKGIDYTEINKDDTLFGYLI